MSDSKYAFDMEPNEGGSKFNKKWLVGGALLLAVAVIGILAYTGKLGHFGAAPADTPNMEKVSTKYEKAKTANVEKLPLPEGDELSGKVWAAMNVYDWHGNVAAAYANGGKRTLENSLIGKENIILQINHQDDTMKTIEEFRSRIDKFKATNGAEGGNLMFTIMGNSSVSLIQPLNAELKKIDPSYRAIAIDVIGKSDGEDQVIGLAELEKCPECWQGKMIVAVYDDGDMQLLFAMLDKLGVKVNFNYKTWDPTALNIAHVSDFKIAGQEFINNATYAPRPVFIDGKATGGMSNQAPYNVELHPDLTASWTPVDRSIYNELKAKKDPRLAKLKTLVSTGKGEERGVMPTTLIVFNKWAELPKNTTNLVNMLYAIHKSADQIDSREESLYRAMEICTDIMGSWDESAKPEDNVKARVEAYKGYDGAGSGIRIGGSTGFSFKDAMNMLNLDASGSGDIQNSTFGSVYRAFGKVTVERYPEKELKSFDPFESFFDPRYLRGAILRAKGESYPFTEIVQRQDFSTTNSGENLGGMSYKINFKSGSADLDASGLKVVQEIQDKYAGSEYRLIVIGHTDKTGSLDQNKALSLNRANAVKNLLVTRNANAFGGDRIQTDGQGFSKPPTGVNPSYNGACDECRRVEIQLVKLSK